MDCTICVEKTKALISCVVTVQLICDFVFAFADCYQMQRLISQALEFVRTDRVKSS